MRRRFSRPTGQTRRRRPLTAPAAPRDRRRADGSATTRGRGSPFTTTNRHHSPTAHRQRSGRLDGSESPRRGTVASRAAASAAKGTSRRSPAERDRGGLESSAERHAGRPRRRPTLQHLGGRRESRTRGTRRRASCRGSDYGCAAGTLWSPLILRHDSPAPSASRPGLGGRRSALPSSRLPVAAAPRALRTSGRRRRRDVEHPLRGVAVQRPCGRGIPDPRLVLIPAPVGP